MRLATLFATAGLKPRFARERQRRQPDRGAGGGRWRRGRHGVARLRGRTAVETRPAETGAGPFVIAAAWPATGLLPVAEAFLQCAREAAAHG